MEPLLSFIAKVGAAAAGTSHVPRRHPAQQAAVCACAVQGQAVQLCTPAAAAARTPPPTARAAPPQVTAARVAATQAGGAPKPLREQAFAAPERVAELVGRVREALAGALPAAAAKMRAYLPSPATRAILFKPIKSNVAEAHGQVGRRRGAGLCWAGVRDEWPQRGVAGG